MQFEVHKIRTTTLQPYFQYILFNYNHILNFISSKFFPNTDIGVGLVKGEKSVRQNGKNVPRPFYGFFAYVMGLYLSPYNKTTNGLWSTMPSFRLELEIMSIWTQ